MKIAIAGCLGRMGSALIEAVQADARFQLVAGSERANYESVDVQTQLAAFGCGNMLVTSDPVAVAKAASAVIDFTSPEATLAMAEAVAAQGGIHIIGTTGFTPEQLKALKQYAKKACIVQSGNFSLGVNLVAKLAGVSASVLDASYDAEIYEMHHKHKKDAPSGTALMLGNAIAEARGVSLADKQVTNRNGLRKEGDIGFSVARGGEVVGIHTVTFAGTHEVIEIKHQGFSRSIYAQGALHAVRWAKGKRPGLYSMQDVLGL
ncbi:MAG: 4-hydroxy-tetrahydrodipicolinate reductase [Alphaproteobacteria bacterium]